MRLSELAWRWKAGYLERFRRPLNVQRIARIPLVRDLCSSAKGRALAIEPGDVACVTGPLDPVGYEVPFGMGIFEVFMSMNDAVPSSTRRSEYARGLAAQYEKAIDGLGKILPANRKDLDSRQLVSFAIAAKAEDRQQIVEAISRLHRVVIHRAKRSSSRWRIGPVQAEAGYIIGDVKGTLRADDERPSALGHSTLRMLARILYPEWIPAARLARAIGIRLGAAPSVSIQVLADTLWRGGFVDLDRLADPMPVFSSGLVRLRYPGLPWSLFMLCVYKTPTQATTDALATEFGRSKRGDLEFELFPVENPTEIAEMLTFYEGAYLVFPGRRMPREGDLSWPGPDESGAADGAEPPGVMLDG